MDDADAVWNRVCENVWDGPADARSGDRALADMLLVHGVTMNGGVLHALEFLDGCDRHGALDGYRYFGFDEVHALFDDVKRLVAEAEADGDDDSLDDLETEADDRYHALVPADHVLDDAFRARFAALPDEFAPIR
jgi:hypothetical protein